VPCGGSAELADGISSVTSLVVGPLGYDGRWYILYRRVNLISSSTGWLADVVTDVGTDMDFYRFC
jgi:hypothetical protein